jgi:hypothetical protein
MKLFSCVRPHRNVAEILLQQDNADYTYVWKHRKQSQYSDGLFFPTHHASHNLCPQISTPLRYSKIPNVGKCFGGMTRLLKKWLRVKNSNWYNNGDTWHCASLKQGCWNWRRPRRKIRCLVKPFIYPINIFKKSYNKFLSFIFWPLSTYSLYV